MPASPSWQAWRLALLPVAESILRRKTASSGKWRPPPLLHKTKRLVPPITRSIATGSTPPIDLAEETDITHEDNTPSCVSDDIKARWKQIDRLEVNAYPRYTRDATRHRSLFDFHKEFLHLTPGTAEECNLKEVVVEGRIQSVRIFSKKLAFIDIAEEQGPKLQVLLNYRPLEGSGLPKALFTEHVRLLRRGDVISVRGQPHRTETGELSIKAMRLPVLLTPCLHDVPWRKIQEDAGQDMDKHVLMLSDPEPIQLLKTRAKIIRTIRDFFNNRSFIEVQTPILDAAAGGAIARPFETVATEFSNRKLNLRIAPELWLKRLIVGGMSKVFEIGPSFRNEGLDKTHNPEFTTCEFYQTYTALSELLSTTEWLLSSIVHALTLSEGGWAPPASLMSGVSTELKSADNFFKGPYPQLDFILALNDRLKIELPNLASPAARQELLLIFEQKGIPVPPNNPTLPRLLDKLCSTFLEPECLAPTWITNIPECLSPLSKSFIHPTAPNNQPVAARAELFVQSSEIVNCYEEENSPWEQRRKFVMQQEYVREAGGPVAEADLANVDEDYLRALEWGLPPTGGWGCGIDRLVMMFTGKQKIGDVLSFGNLRRVTRGAEKVAVRANASAVTTMKDSE